MKKITFLVFVVLFVVLFLLRQSPERQGKIVNVYPWQVEIVDKGATKVFGITLNTSTLKDVNQRFNMAPSIALYELKNERVLEAYYKNKSLGGLIGSFIISLNANTEQLNKLQAASKKQERTKNREVKYLIGTKDVLLLNEIIVKNITYIPTVQLDEATIIQRFGEPASKLKLKTKEKGWHYLYPEIGLDIIYKEEGKEVLQYVLPKNFNEWTASLRSH
ncbi:MAG: hypothetical protein QM484_08490 [Woeseiaceae bacterium]